MIYAVWGKREAEAGSQAKSLSREQKDDNIIKLPLEEDEGQER